MGVYMRATITCDERDCNVTEETRAELRMCISAGGGVDLDIDPEVPHGWLLRTSRWPSLLCPEHARDYYSSGERR